MHTTKSVYFSFTARSALSEGAIISLTTPHIHPHTNPPTPGSHNPTWFCFLDTTKTN